MGKAIAEFQSPATMREAGEFAVERIKTRTRLGRGVDKTGGESVPLKPLSQSYRDARRGKVAFFTDEDGVVHPYKPKSPPKLSPLTSPGRSNLTFSGQMLDALRVISVATGRAVLGWTSTRKREGGRALMTNEEIASFVSKERPFFNLSGPEISGLQRFIRERITKLLKSR